MNRGLKSNVANKPRQKPFIVDAPATMLKRNKAMSRNARILYIALRALANGRTGELKIHGAPKDETGDESWLKATAFDHAAEMCRGVRLRSMRELITLGLVSVERARVERVINGRRRVVLGQSRYTVHKSSRILLKSISCTVQEIDSQDLSKPPFRHGSAGFRSETILSGKSGKSSSAPTIPAPHDDDHFPSRSDLREHGSKPTIPVGENPTHAERILARAAATLEKRGEDPRFVSDALAFIDQRSYDAGTTPGSERYYLDSYETLLQSRNELAKLTDAVIQKQRLRDKFMPGLIRPSEKDAAKIAVLHRAVEEASELGRPASEIMAERLAMKATG